ncbi:hypothetical protein MKEN_00786700 [Mycena kentingensis (nom. inval.)]|nr:hypothetical protein MKEN_00786700 [Mycena kentingensis (nom. inval.)]
MRLLLRPFHFAARRAFATRPHSPLPKSLDQQYPRAGDKGTFQLGFGVGQTNVNRNERVPEWKELSTAGKVNRTAAGASNLTIVLLGATLSSVLIYCLTSELFSNNSPTVLYKQACEKIEASQRLRRFLDGPPRFYLDPPASERPRHRNRHVSSTLRVDAASGREHLFLNFYLQSSPQSPSFLDSASAWTQDKLTLSWEELLERSKQSGARAWSKAKDAARYLSGAPPPVLPDPPANLQRPETAQKPSNGFMDMFSSLRRPRGTTVETKPDVEARQQFNEGEVHVSYIKNNDGDFVLRYIIVELPSSKSRNPVRVFVERAPGVRDNEPVMLWSPSQH